MSLIEKRKTWKRETEKINIDTCIKELRDYIDKDPKWIEATKDIDFDKLSTDKLKEKIDLK
ncbi:MAG: hypothetical protein Hyperionvirus18_8 [Hyperionvirus sp.]|uniref:Uncharacterized protein n=1 Tax=Hyperionvirus sp. TaxID=2487770 RepID=A0A3G5AAK5_9VIRU|nr:MAG: hypothetical protein Hyperionvirus18_8 [Hyperionvirus sp.]